MYEIKANIAEVRGAAAEIENQASIIRNEVEQIADLLGTLRQTFLGNRAGDFFQKFDAAHGQMQEWDELVLSFAAELQEAAARYESADQPA
jgi:WXG100 family type VII secretion target